jgi:hypothetical protein
MKHQTRNTLFALAAVAALFLATTACSFSVPRLGNINQEVEVSIPAEMFNNRGPHFTVGDTDLLNGALLDRTTKVELHDGFVRFYGFRTQPDGSEVPGSFDMTLTAENDKLSARITSVDIPGMKVTDPLVVRLNNEIKVDLTGMDFDQHAEVLFKEVRITAESLYMKVQVNLDL